MEVAQTRPPDPSVAGDAEFERLRERMALRQFVGHSPALLVLLRKLPAIARTDAAVLISGETGTGKEICARALHYLSPRSDRPFVAVNSGALPADLVENELFGHTAGAYTGAGNAAEGVVSGADGGTLFLDEIDSLPLPAQAKLLRFLQEKEFRPLGARKPRHADVRVVAASNTDCQAAVRTGRFRADLFYRLNVVPLRLPPLRERPEDIAEIAAHFVTRYAHDFGRDLRGLAAAARQKLLAHDWPGNVRELENVIQRAIVLGTHELVQAEDIEFDGAPTTKGEPPGSFRTLKARAIAAFERAYILDLLRSHQGNVTQAARAAGKHRRAFWELMRKHELTGRAAA